MMSARLRKLASLLRKLPENFSQMDQLWFEDRGGRYIADALNGGAFTGDEWVELRHELEYRMGNAASPDYGSVFYGPAEWASRDPNHRSEYHVPDGLPSLQDCCLIAAAVIDRQANRSAERPSQVEAAVVAKPSQKRKMRQPSPEAFIAYRLWLGTGQPQKTIASLMQKQLRRPVNQVKVSRWIRRVKKWLESGNVLPSVEEVSRAIHAIDPEKIDIGRRSDLITPRQRQSARD